MDKIFEITAKEVTVQVKDERTGVVYSRTLPIDYYENANVLKLSGENLDGSSSSIVFYSARGIERLKDLTGRGVKFGADAGSRKFLNRLSDYFFILARYTENAEGKAGSYEMQKTEIEVTGAKAVSALLHDLALPLSPSISPTAPVTFQRHHPLL